MSDIDDEQTPGLFPIRVVSQRTGVNTVTLRAWERRYGLLKPVRTPKGHRLYSEDDVTRVEHIVGWINRGVSISQVRALLERDEAGALPADSGDGDWQAYGARVVRAVAQFDENRLDDVVNEALALYPFATVCERLLHPLGRNLAGRWQGAPGDRAEQAFVEGYLARKLSTRVQLGARHIGNEAPVLLSSLPGETDGVGLLILAVAFHALERPVVLLPAALPGADLMVACDKVSASAIVLHGTLAQDAVVLTRLLSQLAGGCGRLVFVAGPTASIHRELVEVAGAVPLTDPSLAAAARQVMPLRPAPPAGRAS